MSEDQINKVFKDLDVIFNARGFTAEEKKAQLQELGRLIMASSLDFLLTQKPPATKFSLEEEAVAYVKSSFSPEEIEKAVERESIRIVQEYFQEIA